MNLAPRWAEFLIDAGHDAVHWSAAGAGNASDSDICERARSESRIVITNDLDFTQILAHTRLGGPSVVLLRGEPLVPEVRGGSLLLAIEACRDDLFKGAILSLDLTGKPRARLLPL